MSSWHDFLPILLDDRIDVHEMGVLILRNLRGQKHVEPLDEVHDVSQIVARLEPSPRVLLGHKKSQHERQELVLDVQPQDVGEISQQVVLRLPQKLLMLRPIFREMKKGVPEDGPQRSVNNLKIVLRRLSRRQIGKRIEIVHQNEVALERRC